MPHSRVHAIVEAFDVDLNDAIKIFRGRGFDRSDVRDTGIVDEDVNSLALGQFLDFGVYIRQPSYIALMRDGGTAVRGNLIAGLRGGRLVYIEDVNCGAMSCEFRGYGPSDAAASAGDNGCFAVEPKRVQPRALSRQSDTPRFQGMKSS
jgi:hypothetical protein